MLSGQTEKDGPAQPSPSKNNSIGAPQEASSSDAENKPKKNRRKTKAQMSPQRCQKTFQQLFGPQSETWTRYYVINTQPSDKEKNPNNIKVWTELKKYLGNNDFTCVRREDGSILIDANTKQNADKIAELENICNIKTTAA